MTSSPHLNPFDALRKIEARAAEAIIGQSGLSHAALKAELRRLLTGGGGKGTGLMQAPVVECAHPFVTAEMDLEAIRGTLLHPDFVDALSAAKSEDYRVELSRKPYQHQLKAWQTLTAPGDPQSVVVTSGTGSGKTECFLYPILSDLARQAAQSSGKLEGVQAILLYPLNALIESQRGRFEAWTEPQNAKVRYALFNSDLPNSVRADIKRLKPYEVADREDLRGSPPPVLVTNITMLEYMLARGDDQPILEKSQGKLKWVVLDEAHSLMGAAAAEVALLLRRVMMAFDVRPEDVHFIATSATIGGGAADGIAAKNSASDIRDQLKRFLADVGGIDLAKVYVIEGHRQMPSRPAKQLNTLPIDAESAPDTLYHALANRDEVWRLVSQMHRGAATMEELAAVGSSVGLKAEPLAMLLAKAARTVGMGQEPERLAPLRVHGFERALSGVWSCVNPACKGAFEGWRFGGLFLARGENCPHCKAPVLEIISCTDCGEAMLVGVEIEDENRLAGRLPDRPADEFTYHSDDDTEGSDDSLETGIDDAAASLVIKHLFPANPPDGSRPLHLNCSDWSISDRAIEGGTLQLLYIDPQNFCPCCGKNDSKDQPVLRSLRFGAPFLVANAAPLLLEAVEAEPDDKQPLPSKGRRLLSFTDSRQGTARMAAKLQAESERNFLRSFVYHAVQNSMRPDPVELAKITQTQANLDALLALTDAQKIGPISQMIAQYERDIAAAKSGSTAGMSWNELVEKLSLRPEVKSMTGDVWGERDADQFKSESHVARFLLLREFSRRPARANSMETLGLAKLRFDAIDQISSLPKVFLQRGKPLSDWHDYLQAVLTFYIRANSAITMSRDLQRWVMPRLIPKRLARPGEIAPKGSGLLGWPSANSKSSPVRLLVKGFGFDPTNAGDCDDLEELLRQAYDAIQCCMDADTYALDFAKAHIAPVTHAWLCPLTRRIIDVAPFGLSTGALRQNNTALHKANAINMPVHPNPEQFNHDASWMENISKYLEGDQRVNTLRCGGAWNNISDRVSLYAPYARTAEHSAQLESSKLRGYEAKFKAGEINILNCSTTMEMGVDIGNVTAVMMTNVPPSIANYRQRVGRAGRRGQAVAVSFTFCKDRPLELEAFSNPKRFLGRFIPAPAVALESRSIVQRHINAWLLAMFFRSQDGQSFKMKAGPFFGRLAHAEKAGNAEEPCPSAKFGEWLVAISPTSHLISQIQTIAFRSVLEKEPAQTLIEAAKSAIEKAEAQFEAEWNGLRTMAANEGALRSKVDHALTRLCDEMLLNTLANLGFLPGHSFPTDVVSFDPGPKAQNLSEVGGKPVSTRSRSGYRDSGPKRPLDVAIREYAPGSQIVLDGLVYVSAGLTLNWKKPAALEHVRDVQSLKTHYACNECGNQEIHAVRQNPSCECCGSAPLLQLDFIRPGGFTVDYRTIPNAETDHVRVVAAETPKVSARGARWRNLANANGMKIRSSADGMVFFAGAGAAGHGYAICLHCGRAASETAEKGPLPQQLVDHVPLRWNAKSEGSTCSGNQSEWAIIRNKCLGHHITTDVVEIALNAKVDKATATALIIALREALCGELGIRPDEIGYATGSAPNRLGGKLQTVLLFDRASGGGGFSTSFEAHLRNVLKRAEILLDCQTPGCIHGCSACVLTRDAPDESKDLHRVSALEFMRFNMHWPESLDDADQIHSNALLCVDVIAEMNMARRNAVEPRITVFLHTTPESTQFETWNINAALETWRSAKFPVELAIPRKLVLQMDFMAKLVLRDFAQTRGCTLVERDAPDLANGHHALALVANAATATLWSSRWSDSNKPGETWGEADDAPIISSPYQPLSNGQPIDHKTLLPSASSTRLYEIVGECDGPLSAFGKKLAGLFLKELKAAGAPVNLPVSLMSYEDAYLRSPLTMRLLIETASQLALQTSANKGLVLKVKTRLAKIDRMRPAPAFMYQDYEDHRIQQSVMTGLGEARGLSVQLAHSTDVGHARQLLISFGPKESSQVWKVILDQGFGAWALTRGQSLGFSFTTDVAQQVKCLLSAELMVERRGFTKTYCVFNKL